MSMLDKLKKNSTIKKTSVLTNSIYFTKKDVIQTSVPIINVGFSGSLTGGYVPGITTWAGPSKHFKTNFALLQAKAYLDKYKDAALLFYDSEFGSPQSYFDAMGIDSDRVIHTPIMNIEELKFDLMNQLTELERDDKVVIVIDSIGNMASVKEVEDALAEKSAADMTRAKQLKSLFRMITPHLNSKNIPLIVINHTYKEITMYPKDIVSGGTGGTYSSDCIFILGRQQDKDDKTKDINGYDFIINVEKSRYVREKSKFAVSVSFKGGINKWSGLLDLAVESGHVQQIKTKYFRVDTETGLVEENGYKRANTDTAEFWGPVLQDPKFNAFVEEKYKLPESDMLSDAVISDAFDNEDEEDD